MGRASRAKQNRGPRRSRAELIELLAESREFLVRSAQAFDEGYEAEAKRLAVVLRVLLHDTQQSHSLLKQLGAKDRLGFLDSAAPINPNNLMPTPGLVLMQMTMTAEGPKGDYIAPLDMDRHFSGRQIPFTGWWINPVMNVDGTWSRRELVLALSNQEGGAHVDPSLNRRYEDLAKRNGLGWVAGASEDDTAAFVGNVVAIAVRQITHEVLNTLDREQAHLT